MKNKITLRTISTIILIILMFNNLTAQLNIPVGSRSEIGRFFTTTTYIVVKNDIFAEYNSAIKEVVEKFWTITPYKFINETDFQTLRYDNEKSFIVINQVYFEKDRSKTLFEFLILTIGGKARTINDMPTLCAVPLCYKGAPESDYIYKLGLFVKFIQKHMEVTRNNSNLNSDNISDFYKENSGSVSNKKLYVLTTDLESDIRNPVAFKNVYSHPFKFSTNEEIEELIMNADSQAIILHKIGQHNKDELYSSKCVKIIIDTKDAGIYYYDFHNVNKRNLNVFLSKDLRELAKKTK